MSVIFITSPTSSILKLMIVEKFVQLFKFPGKYLYRLPRSLYNFFKLPRSWYNKNYKQFCAQRPRNRAGSAVFFITFFFLEEPGFCQMPIISISEFYACAKIKAEFYAYQQVKCRLPRSLYQFFKLPGTIYIVNQNSSLKPSTLPDKKENTLTYNKHKLTITKNN